VTVTTIAQNTTPNPRPRASDLGLKVGILPTGPLDAITDVAGVEVGQTTIVRGDDLRTGVTAILPHPGNLYREKVPGAVFVGNGFGKLAGSTQVEEMGDIETPILLTSTTSVPRVADALISYMLALRGNEDVLSINPLVGETNDGYLSDIRGRQITPEDVFAAMKNAKGGPVEEGAVGAGTGTVVFGFKGGIGTSSPPPAFEARRIHSGCFSADEFWWRAHDFGRSGWSGTRAILPPRGASRGRRCERSGRRVGDDRGRNRRTHGRTEPEAVGSESLAWRGSHRKLSLEWQRGLCHCVLHGTASANTNRG
jgi:L-aminopeptidase/D-esterase-like protein